ncbi:MAG: PIN domain-containing protein [Terracidiphilus sp.]|jgi:predicted nucleic acid-binding protein
MSAGKPSVQASPGTVKTPLSRLVELVEADEEVVITRHGRPVARFEPTARLPRTFLDTNILVYGDDCAEPAKRKTALELIKEHRQQRTGVVSLQVLQEYFVTVTKKLKLDTTIARNKVEIYSKFHVAEPTVNDILAAIDLHRLHGFSYWDALVLRMAKQTGCRVLLSEDMPHGQVIDGVRIVNPFL